MQTSDLSFEISDGGDLIRLEPLKYNDYNAQLDWDRNWIRTKVTIKGGVFTGQFTTDFMTTDFELFKRDLKKLDTDFKGTGNFEPVEGQLTLNITGDGLGHFEVKCSASDNLNYGGILTFSLSFDQTELTRLINELEQITIAFPIIGHLNIQNQ